MIKSESEPRCIPEYQLNGRWRSVSWWKGSRATCPTVFRFPSPLICRAEKYHPARPPQNPRAPIAIYTLSRPEHENNEPALGVRGARGSTWMKGHQTRGKGRSAHCARVKWRDLEKGTGIGFFATNVSAACRSRSLHTRCPPSKWGRISGRWDAMTTLFACYSRRTGGTAASSKFTSNEQNSVRG